MTSRPHLGTMGWSYDHWVGNFYATSTKQEEYLREYSKRFDTVEVDNTFYRIPSPPIVSRWREETARGFIFSAKFPRSITHEDSLDGSGEKLAVFLRNISLLGPKLGPLLMQFPPKFDAEQAGALRDFLSKLPKGFRFALEVRNRSWLGDDFYSLLSDNGVALALVDAPWMPQLDMLTSDFAYIRWEGDRRKVQGTTGRVEIDRSDAIRRWAAKIGDFLDQGVKVFGYFSKYYSGHPPTDVETLFGHLEARGRFD